MASEFLYILCAGYQVWVAREGGAHVSAQQYLSIRSTDIILPSRTNLGSSPSLSYVSPDTTFPRRHKKQPWKRLCCNPGLENRCPTLLPHNPGQFTVSPDDHTSLHPRQHHILDKLNCVPALRPLQDSPCTTYPRWTRLRPAMLKSSISNNQFLVGLIVTHSTLCIVATYIVPTSTPRSAGITYICR